MFQQAVQMDRHDTGYMLSNFVILPSIKYSAQTIRSLPFLIFSLLPLHPLPLLPLFHFLFLACLLGNAHSEWLSCRGYSQGDLQARGEHTECFLSLWIL